MINYLTSAASRSKTSANNYQLVSSSTMEEIISTARRSTGTVLSVVALATFASLGLSFVGHADAVPQARVQIQAVKYVAKSMAPKAEFTTMIWMGNNGEPITCALKIPAATQATELT